ncbi:hypothetical protein ABFA07_019299 [Porites harrisoni]
MKHCYNLYPGELGRGTEDDCTARLNSLTSAAHGCEVPSKGNVEGNGKKGKNVLEKNTAAEIKKLEKLEQEHPAMQDIDSESEEEDVVGASFDWTGDSTLTLDDNWKDSIEKKIDLLLEKVSSIEKKVLDQRRDGEVHSISTPAPSKKRVKFKAR